jgi:hypothetical protein
MLKFKRQPRKFPLKLDRALIVYIFGDSNRIAGCRDLQMRHEIQIFRVNRSLAIKIRISDCAFMHGDANPEFTICVKLP